MDFEIVNGPVTELETDCIVIGIEAEGKLSPTAAEIDKAAGGYLNELTTSGDLTGKAGEQQMLFKVPGLNARRVLVIGLGKAEERKDRHYRKLVTAITGTLKRSGIASAVIALDGLASDQDDTYRQTRQFVEWCSAELYQYDATKSKKADPIKLEKVALLLSEDDTELGEGALLDGVAIANGVSAARDVANLPGNICTPSYLAERAIALAENYETIKVEILDEAQMEELGMGALLAVGRGSSQPSRLIVMRYTGADKEEQPHALVGKGITFDTGGISLKPGADMDEMKFDMGGAASVLGTMETLAEMHLPLNVVGIIAAAENMPAGNAVKPGDIVTTLSGKTVEILNTDAEGRLVLCDALSYAERYNPQSVIDIATLTGACIIALGHQATGLLSNDQALADSLLDAGEYAADRAWQLPLWDEFQEQLDSNFADMANIGGRPGGTITAACFLSRFTEQYRWAHLDIAGVAWKSGKQKGATGRCVPLLAQYLLDLAEQKEGGDDAE
ncbi:leucyl aminopeptidase [Marinobacterium litorale]|uniref:leucyl aminopeptidase n=1 Tax=Marinobacterium litorale TaxID=404770 RepID=UPI00041B75D3|nr:leucyl aminopeptidase [Marinobacterium litorale]